MWQSLRAAALLALVITGGCVTVAGYPERPAKLKAELESLDQYFVKDIQHAPLPDGKTPKAWRDEVMDNRIRAHDLLFGEFKRLAFEQHVVGSVGVDWALLALSGVGVVSPSQSTKTVLAAMSGGLVGAKASIDKHVLYEKTLSALFAEMEAQRTTQLAAIRNNQLKGVNEYSLSRGLGDVEKYFQAGSIPSAIDGIVVKAGASQERAMVDVRQLERASTEEVVSITAIRAKFNELYRAATTLDPSDDAQKRKTEALKAARDAAEKLGLTIEATAKDEDLFKRLNEEIRKAMDNREQLAKLQDAFNIR